MKAITQQRNQLQDMERLIIKMKLELDLVRNILYRSYLEHNNKIMGGIVEVKDHISFSTDVSKNGDPIMVVHNHESLSITSNYEYIVKLIDSLS